MEGIHEGGFTPHFEGHIPGRDFDNIKGGIDRIHSPVNITAANALIEEVENALSGGTVSREMVNEMQEMVSNLKQLQQDIDAEEIRVALVKLGELLSQSKPN